MVKRALFIFLLLCFSFSAGASASMEEKEAPKRRPAIKKVIIEDNGAWSDRRSSSDETREDCAENFVLKESDVRQFFKVARFSTSHEHAHDLIVSRCYAAGRVVLRDGQEASWTIDRARLGILMLPDDSRLYFYCGKCRNKAYMEDCDIDCINAP